LPQDTKEARHIKTYEISERDKDFVDGPWQQPNLDGGASLIIPVPAPLGGAIVVGEQSIVYLNGAGVQHHLSVCMLASGVWQSMLLTHCPAAQPSQARRLKRSRSGKPLRRLAVASTRTAAAIC
jgi:hypothetical protein